ncbi:MAG: HEAT repeat domain-containing protein [Deltaproteobacteria bacterium]|nr:MAG: HEAT repeat domain-containing protein [Deltaproteobacteria bacterium]
MVSRFSGREIIAKPACPFCGMLIDKPRESETQMQTEMPVGKCSCGAVYACDVTGHNLGTALIEALVFGCDGDWDLAWDLLPEEDFNEAQLKGYDFETHLVIHGGVYQGRRISGTLYFVRLHRYIPGFTGESAKKRLDTAAGVSQRSSRKKKGRKALSKKEVEAFVEAYDLSPLLNVAKEDKRIIRDLQRLIYSVDKRLRWRATDALGKVSGVIAKYDPGAISKLLQRLFSASADTAASSWGCLDAIGEIISNNPEQFGGYMPQLYQFAGDRALLAEVLRALGKIGVVRPDLIRKTAHRFIPFLQDPDPEIRGYAAILLGNLGAQEAKDALTRLAEDASAMEVYGDGRLEKQTIGQLASQALDKL